MSLKLNRNCGCKNEMKIVDKHENKFGQLWFCSNCFSFEIEMDRCEHTYTIYKIDLANGHSHVMTKCSECGKHKETHKKSEFNLEVLPLFDYDVERNYSDEYWETQTSYHKLIKQLRFEYKQKSNAWNIENWYYGYLESKMWQKKRDWILENCNYKCQSCGNDAKYVHHKTYERVGYEKPEDLMAVCKKCHGLEHGKNKDLNIVSQFKLHKI